MAWEEAMFALTNGLLGLIFTPALLPIVVPVLTLTFIFRFLRWSNAAARGTSEGDMREDYSDVVAGYRDLGRRARGEYGPDLPPRSSPRAPWNRRRR